MEEVILIRERNAVAGFLVLLAVMMAFYCLGLLLGHSETESALTTSTPSSLVTGKSKANVHDPRSELDFINASVNNESDANRPPSRSRDASAGRLLKNGAALENNGNPSQEILSVLVGTFDDKHDAQRLADELSRKGYSARIVPPLDNRSDSRFRVYVGRYTSPDQAKAMARRLNRSGFTGEVKAVSQ